MSAETRLWEIIEAAARAVTASATGRFEHKEFVQELRRRLSTEDLPANVREASFDEMARRLADSFVNRRKPKQRATGALFHPSALLPLGDGKRVWMEDATDADVIAWAGLEARNAARVLASAGTRQTYAAERLDAMRVHPGWLLGRIERDVFGYTETDAPYGFDEDEDAES